MKVVRNIRAERQVVTELTALPEKIVVVERRREANRPAAGLHSIDRITVSRDERRTERVRSSVRCWQRDIQQAKLVKIVEVDVGS